MDNTINMVTYEYVLYNGWSIEKKTIFLISDLALHLYAPTYYKQ